MDNGWTNRRATRAGDRARGGPGGATVYCPPELGPFRAARWRAMGKTAKKSDHDDDDDEATHAATV